jgi:3-methyladenine DNA glycosylase AlkD
MKVEEIQKRLRGLADTAIAEHSQRFFKTGKGEYGEGDKFLGIRVPVLRREAAKVKDLPLEGIQLLVRSAFHEERLFAVLLLVERFTKGNRNERSAVYQLYLKNKRSINNWDLVDISAPHILGAHLEDKDRRLLYELAASESVWERRMSIMATFYFIRKSEFTDALHISSLLVNDKEDLIHKAVGWMLREVGKRDMASEKRFLKKHYRRMPRTMLRYAIERFPEKERKAYLHGEVG